MFSCLFCPLRVPGKGQAEKCGTLPWGPRLPWLGGGEPCSAGPCRELRRELRMEPRLEGQELVSMHVKFA